MRLCCRLSTREGPPSHHVAGLISSQALGMLPIVGSSACQPAEARFVGLGMSAGRNLQPLHGAFRGFSGRFCHFPWSTRQSSKVMCNLSGGACPYPDGTNVLARLARLMEGGGPARKHRGQHPTSQPNLPREVVSRPARGPKCSLRKVQCTASVLEVYPASTTGLRRWRALLAVITTLRLATHEVSATVVVFVQAM